MVMPGTRLGVFFATCLAGRGRGNRGTIFLSLTQKLIFNFLFILDEKGAVIILLLVVLFLEWSISRSTTYVKYLDS